MTSKNIMDEIHKINLEMFKEFDRVCRKYDVEYCFACGALLGAIRHKGFIPWDNDIDIWITRENFKKLYEHKDEFKGAFEFVMPEIHGDKKYLDCVPRLNYKYMYIKMDPSACAYYSNRNNRMDLDIFFIDKTYCDYRGKIQRLELAFLYGLMNVYRHKSINAGYSWPLKIANKCLYPLGKLLPLRWLRKRVETVSCRYNNRKDANYFFASNDGAALKKIVPAELCSEISYTDFENCLVPVPKGATEVLKIWFGDYMKLPPKEEQIPHWGKTLIDPDNFVFEEPAEL